MRASLGTFLLHVEARIASYISEGFYTIGPCGEELVSVLGLIGKETDPFALHYRHVGVQLTRQFQTRSEEDVMLDRARGFTCSTLDPVTAGHHCALGGGKNDFYVTSTLASQCPAVMGRAMGIRLAPRLLGKGVEPRFSRNAVSVVSLGDGSVNNAMFLSSLNLCKYAQFRGFKMPALIVISNNDLCISLRGYGYLRNFLKTAGIPVYETSGAGAGTVDLPHLWKTTEDAFGYVRKYSRPAILLVDGLTRRFGHAATDRQINYMDSTEIESKQSSNPLEQACTQALELGLVESPRELLEWWDDLEKLIETSFEKASSEPKITTREQVMEKTMPPLADISTPLPGLENAPTIRRNKPQPMRNQMNNVFREALTVDPVTVYVGEDVRHGGYYRVTDDLAKEFPERIQDVPPDETSVFGIGLGYAQSGLLPIVEMPYAKYLDCGADMFFEIAMTYWCTGGKQKNGMLIRLQGFDKGVFGGNFHTHNMLHLPPGLDVVCYSNGWDYARGMRHALYQAKHAGRVVMSVDSTDLLYRRSLYSEEDTYWLRSYPEVSDGVLGFETVIAYTNEAGTEPVTTDVTSTEEASKIDMVPDLMIFSYGNGVPTSLRAAHEIAQETGKKTLVVDCPTLGRPTEGMRAILQKFPNTPVVFADVCKQGQNPFSGTITALQSLGDLQKRSWQCAASPPTYNPLGITVTFLNENDIKEAFAKCD